MKKMNLTTILLFATMLCYSQKRKNVFPLWTYHTKDKNINGISFGIGTARTQQRNVNTNGIKIELIGAGIIVPLIPESPLMQNASGSPSNSAIPISEHINGIVLSASGTVCDCVTNGIVVGFIGHINQEVNGISAAGMLNYSQINNGVQIATLNSAHIMNGLQIGFGNSANYVKGLQVAFMANASEDAKGVQVGIYNKAKKLRGFQVGLWNVNQKRKLPLINWAFSDKK
jgi:hypothetical protein